MNAIRSLLFGAAVMDKSIDGLKPSLSEQNVYPVHTLDSMKDYETFVATVMLFNDVLDADILNTSLSRLLEIGDWRKLGGRLKRDSNGRLRIHVPQFFSPEQPAITFTHECLRQTQISHHPIAKLLPTPTHCPSIQPLPSSVEFRTLQVRKDFPTSVDALINAGLPLLSLHIHTFQDATVVGLAWPHMLMDGDGRAQLMRGWSLVMAGQEDKVPYVAGARHDVLLDLPPADSDQDKFFADKGLLHITGLAKFICRWQWEKLTGYGKVSRAIYLPRASYDLLVGGIKDDVSRIEADLNKKLYASDTDAITGWITQQVALSEPRPRPVTIMSIINFRYRLGRLLNLDGVYLQNMLLMTYTLFSAQEARGAAATLALAHREQVAQQTTQPRLISFIQWLFKQIESRKSAIPLCGKADSVFICVNSLTKANLITGADFAPAVLRQGEIAETRSNPPGTMVNFFFKDANIDIAAVNALTVLGKGHNDGTWFAGNLSPKTWEYLEQQFKVLKEQR